VVDRARRYLIAKQAADGSWVPLWFGNQDHPREENPVYGTAKVLKAYSDLLMDLHLPEVARGITWLISNQNDDGGWGSGAWNKMGNANCEIQKLKSSVEETALAVESLISAYPLHPLLSDEPSPQPPLHPSVVPAVHRGLAWLIDRVEQNEHRQPTPIGFYFAKLWYYEKLYPLTLTVAALGRACLALLPPNRTAADNTKT